MHRIKDGFSFRALAMSSSTAVVVTDATLDDDPIVFVNAAFSALTGYEASEVIGRNCRFLQGEETDQRVVEEIAAAVQAGTAIRRELINYRRDGSKFWMDLSLDPVSGSDGRPQFMIGIQYDISEKHFANERRLVSEQRLSTVIDNIPGFVFQMLADQDGTICFPFVSSSIGRILKLPANAGVLPDLARYIHPEDALSLKRILATANERAVKSYVELRLRSSASAELWFRATMSPRRVATGELVWDGLAVDITAEKLSASQLAYVSHYDDVTELINRKRLTELIDFAVKDMRAPDDDVILVQFVLIDFAELTETFGLYFADAILRRVGFRLREFGLMRRAIPARIAVDEFSLLLPASSREDESSELCSALAAVLAFPMNVDGHELILQACFGVACMAQFCSEPLPSGPVTSEELIEQAHLAVQAARQEGPGTWLPYGAGIGDRIGNRIALRHSLQNAIAEEQFELYYQPIVALDTGRIVAAEALVRWNHPTLGVQAPDKFIPLAESSGLIVPLGQWIIKAAMQQERAWTGSGHDVPRIGINLSAIQIRRAGFLARLEQAIIASGVDPSRFEFELTEGILIDGSPETRATLNSVKAMGFSLSIDDFGTGHATLKCLRDFSFDRIKIDQTFVRGVFETPSDASIVRAIIGLSRSLNMSVVAEGVETAAQRAFLSNEGCDIGQGFLFSRPIPADQFALLLKDGVALPTG